MIDMHSHVLYGIDDGSVDFSESMEMLAMAKEVGFIDIVATPHYIMSSEFNSPSNANAEILRKLQLEIMKKQLGIQLYLGNEAFLDSEIIDEINRKKVSTINNTSYVLLETPRHGLLFDHLMSFIFDLQVNGYYVILAHPERYDFIIDNPQRIAELIKRDVLIQLNLLSLTGTYGKEIKDTAMILLEHNMVHFIGSDAHKSKSYKKAGEAIHIVRETIDEDKFIEITESNPLQVLSNQILYPDPPMEIRKKGLFSRLFKK